MPLYMGVRLVVLHLRVDQVTAERGRQLVVGTMPMLADVVVMEHRIVADYRSH